MAYKAGIKANVVKTVTGPLKTPPYSRKPEKGCERDKQKQSEKVMRE